MSRVRTALLLAAALLAVCASVLVAPSAQADTSTTSSTTSSSTPATTSTSTTTSSSTSTSTTAPAVAPTSTVPDSTPRNLSSVPAITAASSGVPVFILEGTSNQAPVDTLIQVRDLTDVERDVTAPNAALWNALGTFYEQGGGNAYLWLTSDEQADTLITATTQIARLGTSADLFVIPGIAALDGQEYLDVATALAALAHGQLGVALLDPPATVVAEVQAASPDVSALVALADQVRTAVADPGSTALYAAPLVDSSGDTVPASVVMAGMLAAQDVHAGVWVPAAGTSITAVGLDVVVQFTNVQLDTLEPEVNSFRHVPNYGTIMWGDRTLDSNSAEFDYLSVDRTADWIHRSIAQSVGWAVFQPNDQATQDAVETAVSSFLTTWWKQGAMVGATTSQAFQISFGQDPPNLWGVGEGLWLQVGLALVYPVEFIPFDLVVPTSNG